MIRACIIVLTILFAHFFAPNCNAQTWGDFRPLTTPCNPCHYPSAEWDAIDIDSAVITINECVFLVLFQRRVCGNDGCQELKVNAIIPVDPIPCEGITDADIPTLVLGKMVKTNAMGFWPDTAAPGQNGCWKIIRPRCWRKRLEAGRIPCAEQAPTPVNDVEGAFLPCDPDNCCVNVLYPFLPNCGVAYEFVEPGAEEYFNVLRQISTSEELDPEEIEAANTQLARQFLADPCIMCSDPPQEPPLNDEAASECRVACSHDLIKSYQKIVDRLMLEQFR